MIERTVSGLHAHLFQLLENRFDMNKSKSILDIGCGSGAWLNRLRAYDFDRMVGIDNVQPEPIIGIDLRKHDINSDSPSSLGQFDIVFCIEVIEHIENIGNLLDLVKESIAENGFAVITTPNIESIRAKLRSLISGQLPSFDMKSDPTHLCPILNNSLRKMLKIRCLTVAEIQQYPPKKSQSIMFGRPVIWFANLLRLGLPDDLYGDNIIYFIRHVQESLCDA